MSQVERVFLGWEKSPSITVAEHLLSSHSTHRCDFTGQLIVVPTQQAARRIREAMALLTESRGQVTLGLETVMPSFLLTNHERHIALASAWQITSTWSAVLLSDANRSSLTHLFPGGFDDAPTTAWGIATGHAIQHMREQLCLAGLSISSLLTRHTAAISTEAARWNDLIRLETAYLNELKRLNVVDPVFDRLLTAQSPSLPNIQSIALTCIPDLSPIASMALAALAGEGNIEIQILVAAPDSEAGSFDEWGRPRPEIWGNRSINIPEWQDRVIAVAGPDEQAACIPAILSKHAVSHRDVALGAPDASLVPFIAEALRSHDIHVHDPSNRPFTQHSLFSLVSAFLKTAQSREIQDVVHLLKHPDMLQHLELKHGINTYNLLCELDNLLEEHRPVYLDGALQMIEALSASADLSGGREASPRPPPDNVTTEVSERPPYLFKTLAILNGFISGTARESHATSLRHFLETIFIDRTLAADDDTFLPVSGLLDEVLHDAEDHLEPGCPHPGQIHYRPEGRPAPSKQNDASALLHVLSNLSYPAPSHDDAMIVEGWMELPWNAAPLLIVTSMNEGFLPVHRSHSLFLPDGVRKQIGIDCDATTLARDAYILTLLLESRKNTGTCYLITARQGTDSEPLKPSRLLFHTNDDAERMARAAHTFGLSSVETPLVVSPPTPHRTIPFKLSPPIPTNTAPTNISISAINDYLTCPFHYYLRHVLKMNPVEPFQYEPSAAQFGQLIHQTLHDMANDSGLRTTCDSDVLENGLVELLSNAYRTTFGEETSLAVQLSHDMAEQRLRNAVPAEIALRLDGWTILHTEYPVEAQLGGILVKGRIDRIDRHEDGRLLLTDYKTGKSKSTPEGMHLKRVRAESPEWHLHLTDPKKRWVNLQLPLYAWLVRHVIQTETIPTLCIFNLGPLAEASGPQIWDKFNADDLSAALHTAEAAITNIVGHVFWPPAPGTLPIQNLSALFHDSPESVLEDAAQDVLKGMHKSKS